MALLLTAALAGLLDCGCKMYDSWHNTHKASVDGHGVQVRRLAGKATAQNHTSNGLDESLTKYTSLPVDVLD